MVGLYRRLTNLSRLSPPAWRAAFAIVAFPALITIAILILVVGTNRRTGAGL